MANNKRNDMTAASRVGVGVAVVVGVGVGVSSS